MPSWRLVELDAPQPPPGPRRALDPALLAAIVVVTLVALNVVPQLLPHPEVSVPEALPTAPASLEPAVMSPSTSWDAFALAAGPRDSFACGAFDEQTPPSTFDGAPLAMRRIDFEVSIAVDADWSWCVAGARIYGDGVELIGVFRGWERQTALRPALRDGTFTGELAGFGSLGPGQLVATRGYGVLRLPAVVDEAKRDAFAAAAATATGLRLRVTAMAGPWSFPDVPLREGALDVEAKTYGVPFRLHDLRLLPDGVATTLYARSDFPDPAIASFEWDAIDDLGTDYRALPDRRIDGTLPGFYRAFSPVPPTAATRISFTIRRIHLVALDQFSTNLVFR